MPARFIPPYMSDKASNAERKIFNLLHNCNMDCIVFHSVGLADHENKAYGEIDFVILCKYGVLCLEVKGGAVEFIDGLWNYTNKYGEVNKNSEGPFNQAITGMYSLRNYVLKHSKANNKIRNTIFAHGVAFPDTSFTKKGVDIIQEIILDQRNISNSIDDYIKKVFDYWFEKFRNNTEHIHSQLSSADISLLSNIIRSDFKSIPNYKNVIEEIDSQIVKLTDEQVAAFETISDNDRIIVLGSAGTGKTIIGLEYAKKVADYGKKVLFLTYNKILAEYLRHKVPSNIDISYFHGFLGRYIDVIEGKDSDYYQDEVPNKFLEFIELNGVIKYDIVIVDEGQDLLRHNYLYCIDNILSGGLEKGSWCILLDPNQNIYDNNNEYDSCLDMLKKYYHTNFRLNVNCRNTKQIGLINSALHGKYQHPRYLKVEGENVVISSYNNVDDLKSLLLKTIKDLIKKGIDLSDVIMLLPNKYENSSLHGENIFKTICTFSKVSELDFVSPISNTLRYSTVHSFKGLEAKIIILFDFDLAKEKHEMLSYIAISRAKTFLYLFVASKQKEEVLSYLEKENALQIVQLEA